MGLKERLQAEPIVVGTKCSVGRLLSELPADDAEAVQQAIDRIRGIDPNIRKSRQEFYTARRLCDDLRAEGYYIGDTTMTRHIRGRCSCGC